MSMNSAEFVKAISVLSELAERKEILDVELLDRIHGHGLKFLGA